MKRKSEDSVESSEPKVSKLKITSFGSAFRRTLKSENAISVLQEFVDANKKRNVVDEYIKAGGSVKELVDLMKEFDGKNNFIVASTILSAIYHVILKVVSDLLLEQDATEKSCKELLNGYQIPLQNMLTSSSGSISHKKVILKLFTAMVTLSGNLAKIILTSFSFGIKCLRMFTNPSTSKSSQKLRTCFIHFLLSFLMDDNVVLISEFLQKKGLLTSIIPGLIHDAPETIVLVLNTLRLKIVENMKISKTLKLYTFNTAVLRMISKLYDVKEDTSSDIGEEADAHEPSLRIDPVPSAVHELLLLLCTSSKKGILFRQQKSLNKGNPNQLIFSLLEDLKKPWECELKIHLTAEILKVCPEFVESIFLKWKLDLHPRVSDDWIKLINFVIQIIENQNLNNSDANKNNAGSKMYTLFPSAVQKLYSRNINSTVIHAHPIVRYHLMRLLLTTLQKISNSLMEEFNIISSGSRQQLERFLQKLVIPSNILLNAWQAGIDIVTKDDEDDTFNNAYTDALSEDKYYLVLVDLLLVYHSLVPACFSELRELDIVDFNDYHKIESSEFRFKLARLLFLVYDPKPAGVNFTFAMKQFLEYYVDNNDSKLYSIMENVLRSTSFFNGFEDEIVIWLHGLKKYQLGDSFVEALNILAQKVGHFLEECTELEKHSVEEDSCKGENTNLNFTDEVETLLNVEERSLVITRPRIALSPVVFAFLHVLKHKKYKHDVYNDSVQKFTSLFFVHLMHLQTSVKPLEVLLDKYKNAYIVSGVLDYISQWSEDEMPEFPTYPLEVEKVFPLLHSFLLNGGSLDEVLMCIQDSNESEMKLLWNMCIFYTIRLKRMSLLDAEKRDDVSTILIKLLSRMPSADKISCLELLLTNPYFINNFIIEKKKKKSLPIILLDVVLNSGFQSNLTMPKYSILVSPYRYKFINLIVNRQKQKNRLKINHEKFTIDRLIQFVDLSNHTIIGLLQVLIRMPISSYLCTNKHGVGISEWTELIICLLTVVTNRIEMPLDDEYVVMLILKFNEIRENGPDVQRLYDSIIEYIRAFPHHVQNIPKDLVENMCRNCSSAVYKLASYLVVHHGSLASVLQEQIVKNVNALRIELLLEILDRIQTTSVIDERIFENIRKFYLRDITELIQTDDNIWLRKKYRKWTEKIVSELDKETCLKVCKEIEAFLPSVQLNEDRCAIMRILFEKASKQLTYLTILIEKFNQSLCSNQDVLWLCDEISRTIGSEGDFAELLTLPMWQDFIKLSLKIGLQTDNVAIMRALRNVCEKLLSEDSTDATAVVFQMTISHSMFVTKMLNNSVLKIELIELLLVLTRINISLMSANHVPLLLSSYKATLARADQLLLQLLQWYENNNIRFSDCRPYLWGDAAASHYSIKTEISVSLARQPLPNQVLELLDIDIIENTIKSFPLNRPLWPESCSVTDIETVYDLCFMLPVLSHLLAPESRISVQKFCRSGALCLVLSALSCEDKSMRMAAFNCLLRFEFHLFSREKEVQIWQQFINALKKGLTDSGDGQGSENEPPRLACLITTFLANMSLIICETLNPLYSPLSNFLLAKPSFDLNTVPNFFMLFYSSDLKHRDHQRWLLKIIRDGMRYEKDWIVAQRTFLFKFLLQYYDSTISDQSINMTILQILVNALRIEKCRLFLVTKCSLLSWINQAIQNWTAQSHSFFLFLIVNILKLLISAKNCQNLSSTLILLLRKLKSSNIILEQTILEEVLKLASNICCLRPNSNVFSENDIKLILELANESLDSRTRKLFDNVLKYKSILFLNEFCDKGNVEKSIFSILQQFVLCN